MIKNGITLEHIASETGLSSSSVWKAINNKPDVSLLTRKRVLEVAGRLNYKGTKRSSGRDGKVLQRIGLVYYDSNELISLSSIYLRLISGIENEIRKDGGELIVECVTDNFPNCYRENRVDGLVVTKRPDADRLKKLDGIPFVVCPNTPYNGDVDFNCVLQSNEMGASLITRKLIELGHKKIVFASHSFNATSFKERYYGYYHAMRENSLNEKVFTSPDPIIESSGYLSRKIAESGCSAVVASSDQAASCILEDLIRMCIDVPGQISITGWDNYADSTWRGPKLTTIDSGMTQIGIEAVRLLKRICENWDLSQLPVHIHVAPQFVEGETIRAIDN